MLEMRTTQQRWLSYGFVLLALLLVFCQASEAIVMLLLIVCDNLETQTKITDIDKHYN